MNRIVSYFFVVLLACATACNRADQKGEESVAQVTEEPKKLLYGLDPECYTMQDGEIKSGQTIGGLLGSFGVSAVQVDRLDRASVDIFPLKNIRADKRYVAFLSQDSTKSLDYLVYERNSYEYVRWGFYGDSVSVELGEKPVVNKRFKKGAVINSSLWGAIMKEDLPYALAAEMEDVYQWTVDFFGIQKGDEFTVIYDEKFVDDTVSVGVGRIWGARFKHGGKEYYAIPYMQDGKIQYWEADGGSLRKQMLKAPLKFSRISSGFTYSRLHPVHKVYRPHTGVDYAAPTGTEVRAVADGTVTLAAWAGGGGKTIKIKHAGGFETGYLHLNGYAKGIRSGARVSQGQVIGYVGSTGVSTGPHLDYRVWKGGKPINPLKIPQKPAEPIKSENRAGFEYVKQRIMAELNGDVPESEKITELDSVAISRGADTLATAQ